MITSASLVSGPSGVGLGAILFNGVDDRISISKPVRFAVQTFTLEIELWFPRSSLTTYQTIFSSGQRANAAEPAVWLQWWSLDTQHALYFSVDQGPTSYVTAYIPLTATVPRETWTRFVFVVTASAAGTVGSIQAYVGRTAFFQTPIPLGQPIVYYNPPRGPVFLGCKVGDTEYFTGRIGWFRFSSVARDQRYINRAYYLMRRNPIEFLRELIDVEMKATVGPTFDTEAAYIDTIQDGGLQLDGAVTDEVPAADVIDAIVPFRDFRLYRNAAGEYEVVSAKPAAGIEGFFGVDDEQGANNLQVSERIISSLSEAVKALPIWYRVSRDANGEFKDYLFKSMRGSVLSVGADARELALPFVYTHKTADIIRDLRAKRLATRDQQMSLSLGHEGRTLQPGDVIRLEIPAMGVSLADWEILQSVNKLGQYDVVVSPYNPADFVYVPGPMPAVEPPINTRPALDLGFNPRVELIGGGKDQAVVVNLKLGRFKKLDMEETDALAAGEICAAGSQGARFGADTGVLVRPPISMAFGDRFDAVSERTPDGDEGYIETGYTNIVFELQQLPVATSEPYGGELWYNFEVVDDTEHYSGGLRITVVVKAFRDTTVTIKIRTHWSAADPAVNVVTVNKIPVKGSAVALTGVFQQAPNWAYACYGGQYQTITATMPENPVTQLPWTLDEITRVQVGVSCTPPFLKVNDPSVGINNLWVSTGLQARITSIGAGLEELERAPDDFRAILIYRKGPSLGQPTTPREGKDQPLAVWGSTIGFQDNFFTDASGEYPPGRYWYWVGVLDGVGRMRALIGPSYIDKV